MSRPENCVYLMPVTSNSRQNLLQFVPEEFEQALLDAARLLQDDNFSSPHKRGSSRGPSEAAKWPRCLEGLIHAIPRTRWSPNRRSA